MNAPLRVPTKTLTLLTGYSFFGFRFFVLRTAVAAPQILSEGAMEESMWWQGYFDATGHTEVLLVLGRTPASRVRTLISSHIIHQHGLREDGGRVRTTRPPAAHRNVEQEKEGVLVNPLRSFRQVGVCASRVSMIVDVETNHVRFPLNREKMKVVGKALIICKWVGCANAVPAGISGTVDRAVDDRGFLADILHDVDLAAVGPARFVDIGAEHPEGGPDSLSTRYLNARLESSIGLRKLA